MISIKYPDGEHPIPRCILVGYGREQIKRYVCYGCRAEFFSDKDDRPFLCDDCLSSTSDKVIEVESDIERYEMIVGWRQEISTFKKRTNFNYIKVAKRDEYTCQYCGYSPRLFVDFKPMHVDHIRPFSCGGNNSMNNLVMACSDCNLHLSNKMFGDFHEKKSYVIEWRKGIGEPFTHKQWRERAR